jgi:hypothetical protein
MVPYNPRFYLLLYGAAHAVYRDSFILKYFFLMVYNRGSHIVGHAPLRGLLVRLGGGSFLYGEHIHFDEIYIYVSTKQTAYQYEYVYIYW